MSAPAIRWRLTYRVLGGDQDTEYSTSVEAADAMAAHVQATAAGSYLAECSAKGWRVQLQRVEPA